MKINVRREIIQVTKKRMTRKKREMKRETNTEIKEIEMTQKEGNIHIETKKERWLGMHRSKKERLEKHSNGNW